jgi:NAD(P)-dependent dehydrogenase (short-subunit alcohol dehydrogenase family)
MSWGTGGVPMPSVGSMGSQLADRVAVITGGASGIGRATALRFLAEGASVVVGDLNAEAATDLTAEVAEPDRLTFIRTDVAEEHDVEALIGAATERFGRLDVVFNNAGSGGAFGPLTEISVEHWDRTFAILTRGVFLGIKHGARAMIAQGTGGSIINTASIAGLVGGSGPQAYSAAKAAVVNLTLNAAVELAPHRIRVNSICPGVIFTPLAAGSNRDQMVDMVAALQPWPDHGVGADIAGAALWLAGDDSRFVTGESIRVDGGIVAAGTRAIVGVDPHRSWERYTGFAPGTTGEANERRRLATS